jgi:hypothetical protein
VALLCIAITKGADDVSERAPQMSPEAAASPERDRLYRGANPEHIPANGQPVNPQQQRESSDAVGHTAVAGQQRDQRAHEMAPKAGRTAVAVQRNEADREAVARQLGHTAVEREAHRTRD